MQVLRTETVLVWRKIKCDAKTCLLINFYLSFFNCMYPYQSIMLDTCAENGRKKNHFEWTRTQVGKYFLFNAYVVQIIVA
jgi:hypothetical protein